MPVTAKRLRVGLCDGELLIGLRLMPVTAKRLRIGTRNQWTLKRLIFLSKCHNGNKPGKWTLRGLLLGLHYDPSETLAHLSVLMSATLCFWVCKSLIRGLRSSHFGAEGERSGGVGGVCVGWPGFLSRLFCGLPRLAVFLWVAFPVAVWRSVLCGFFVPGLCVCGRLRLPRRCAADALPVSVLSVFRP
jgi:hypothetical protein